MGVVTVLGDDPRQELQPCNSVACAEESASPVHSLTVTRPIAIDLFSGAGGMSLGLEQAGFDVVAAVEYDPVHAATHEFNFPKCEAICGSVADVDGATIRARADIGRRRVDLVAGGPPCQGFSMIGKRNVADDRNNLVMEFQRLVVELDARVFIMENVPGMAVGAQGGVLDELVRRFKRDGYNCLPHTLLTATSFGVPQKRRRLFLVGAKDGETLPRLPVGTFEACPTVWDAIGDLPDIENYDQLLDRDWVKAKFYEPSPYAAALRGDTRDIADYSYKRAWDPTILTSSMRTVHTAKSISRFAKTEPGRVEPTSRFLRLDPFGYCNTLRAGTDSKRGGYTSPRPIHPTEPRVITVREGARLHSFPDWFRFHETKWHGFRQVGNAVAPLVGRAVGASIMASLGRVPGRSRATLKLGDPALLGMTMAQAADYFDVHADVVGTRDRRTA